MNWSDYAVFESDRYICTIRALSVKDARWRLVYRPTRGVPPFSEDRAADAVLVRDTGNDVT